jgi:hypothetical protein
VNCYSHITMSELTNEKNHTCFKVKNINLLIEELTAVLEDRTKDNKSQ